MSERHKIHGEHVCDGMVMPGSVSPQIVERIKSLNMDRDILIAAYLKAGTTWVQELVWMIYKEGDMNEASSIPLHERIKYIELFDRDRGESFLNQLVHEPHPRLMKTHLPLKYFKRSLKEDQLKCIVPLRNPKDVLVSLYHFYRMNGGLGYFTGSWDDFFNMHKNKQLAYGDVIDWYECCWKYRDNPRVLFVKYEDMKRDLKTEVCKMAAFLGKTLSDDVISMIIAHGRFESMRDNKMVNYTGHPVLDNNISPFMRKGIVGDWKNYFTDEQSNFVDEQCKSQLDNIGLTFQWE